MLYGTKELSQWLDDLEAKGADATLIRRVRKNATEFLSAPVSYNTRLTTCAGRAYRNNFTHATRIELNPELDLGCTPDELLQTLIHELAHLMASEFDSMNHGTIWQKCCLILGIKPSRCHNYATMSRRKS